MNVQDGQHNTWRQEGSTERGASGTYTQLGQRNGRVFLTHPSLSLLPVKKKKKKKKKYRIWFEFSLRICSQILTPCKVIDWNKSDLNQKVQFWLKKSQNKSKMVEFDQKCSNLIKRLLDFDFFDQILLFFDLLIDIKSIFNS